MTGSYLYFIGAMAVLSGVIEGTSGLEEKLPRRFHRIYWLAAAVLALGWPVFATILVVTRFIRMFRNG